MASFDVKIKGVSRVQQSVKDLFKKVVTSKETLNQIGEKVVFLTKGTIRTGKSPDAQGGNASSFQPITEGWINRKERLKDFNDASEFYRKGKSNLTFTGQLVDSLDYELKQSSIIIRAFGSRKLYKGVNGKALPDQAKTNNEVVSSLKELGFNVFGITRQMVVVANKIVRTGMVNILRSFNKK